MEWLKDRKNVIIALLALVIILQAATMIYLGYTIKRVADRPVNVSGGGDSFRFPYETLNGYRSQSITVDPSYYQDGQVLCTVEFVLTEKVPASQVVLEYRFDPADAWKRIVMRQGEPMRYSATATATTADRIEYRMLQILNGETVRASEDIPALITNLVGNGDVSVYYHLKELNSKTIRFDFSHQAMIEALQVAEIRLQVNKDKPEEIVLTEDTGWFCTFDDAGFKSMEVTVTYKDGAVRAATYVHGYGTGEPLITR